MSIIRILPEKVASQIAAGEVIDRPASVVRELMDNGIDAGADRIRIEIEGGGKSVIRVMDNGAGMTKDDLLLCVERHATSKIKTARDLFSIRTLGFRGEALPSIASVSKLEITSRPHDCIEGYRITISGGRFHNIQEAGAPAGTTVVVKNLFFNVPARRKFLRSNHTETDHIVDIVSRIALPFSRIGFKLEERGKPLLNLPASTRMMPRLHHLMGRKVAEAIIEAEETQDGVTVKAFLAPAEFARSRGDRLFVYVNGRNIRDRLVTRAVLEGYGQRLMKGQYPQAAIFLEMDPSMVDVNVHPAKLEVRFHDSRLVYQAIEAAIDKTLKRSFHGLVDQVHMERAERFRPVQDSLLASEPRWPYADYEEKKRAPLGPQGGEDRALRQIREAPRVIGQLGNTYILCQTGEGLLMVDQHAAHERVIYESLRKGLEASKVEIQSLLIPYRLDLSTKEKRVVLAKGGQLSDYGIDLDHFGGNTFLLRAVPAYLKNVNWDTFVSELIGALDEGGGDQDLVRDRVLTVVACHGAIRAGDPLDLEEMELLLNQLAEMELPTNCPHGRPVFKQFTYRELERMFRRVL